MRIYCPRPDWALRGLYIITDPGLIPRQRLVDTVEAALRGGASIVQYRNKTADFETQVLEAQALLKTCKAFAVPLIINDNADLALEIGAAGVHIGREDGRCDAIRQKVGDTMIIGVSCNSSLERADEAQALGADYVAFGSLFPSATKPHAVPASLELLSKARKNLALPIVGIGGISPGNARSVVAAGADMIAVISGVFAAENPEAAARTYCQLLSWN